MTELVSVIGHRPDLTSATTDLMARTWPLHFLQSRSSCPATQHALLVTSAHSATGRPSARLLGLPRSPQQIGMCADPLVAFLSGGTWHPSRGAVSDAMLCNAFYNIVQLDSSSCSPWQAPRSHRLHRRQQVRKLVRFDHLSRITKLASSFAHAHARGRAVATHHWEKVESASGQRASSFRHVPWSIPLSSAWSICP